jgi:membrane-associated phospholipid phosphatase
MTAADPTRRPGRGLDSILSHVLVASVSLAAIAVGLAGADLALAEYFHAHRGWLYSAAEIVSWAGQAGWYLVPAAAGWGIGRACHWQLLRRLSGFLFLSVGLSALATDVLKWAIGRARPWIWFSDHDYGFSPFNLASAHQSFPSGHSTTALSAAIALGWIFPRARYGLLLCGSLVALSRMIVYAHYLSDIVAGGVVAWLTVYSLRRWCWPDLMRQRREPAP